MVIPGSGLCYPDGDFSDKLINISNSIFESSDSLPQFIENSFDNYSNISGKRTFYRLFKNSDLSQKKQSGSFLFKGISKEDFYNKNFEFKILNIKTGVWYDLQADRFSTIEKSESNGLPEIRNFI